MTRLNVKIKIIIILIFLAMALGLTSYYCYWLYQNNFQLKQQLTERVSALDILYSKIFKIKTEKERAITLNENIDKIDKSFLPDKREEFLDFIVELENLAANQKLTIDQQLGIKEKSKYAGIDIAPLKISLEGEYKNIILFLNEIERRPEILNVYSINLQAGKDGKATKANLTIDTYWKKS